MPPRIDLSAFGGSDDEGEDFPPKKQLELNALKSKTFSHGITKKTKKDLEREAEEKKRKEEEEALRLVNAEYEEAFEGPSAFNAPRGGVAAPNRRPMGPGGGFVRAGGAPMDIPRPAPYQPPRGPSSMGYGTPRQYPPPPMTAPSAPPPSSAPRGKGKRAMDSFLQEIKHNQNAREERLGHLAKQEGSSVSALAGLYSRNCNNPKHDTTNLFISNLPSNINEESLGLFFAKLGPVGAVKIMWPRGDEDSSIGAGMTISRRSKPGLSGFVSYMKRSAAERAVREYDGLDWGGSVLRVGWSKPVPLPLRPIYDLGSGRESRERGRSASPKHRNSHRDDKRDYDDRRGRDGDRDKGRSRSRSHSPQKSKKRSKRSPSYSSSSSRSPSPARRKSRRRSYSSYSSNSYDSRSPSPRPRKVSAKDKWLDGVPEEQRKFIKTVAGRVKDHGRGFEDLLRKKEKENPKFAFLFNEDLPEYHLYQLSIDSRYRIPTPPPDDFADEGYASMYSSDSAEDSEKERVVRGKLGRLARKRFEAMLRVMSGKRAEIARGMEFALKKAEAADEVAEIVCQSVRLDATPVPRKMARLHLISDILHNSASSLPNVWKYRQAFESRLPPVFAHLSTVYQSLLAYSGKISADVFRGQVFNVLEIWERWIVFNSETAEYLRGLLDGTKSLTLPKDAKTMKEDRQKEEEEAALKQKTEEKDHADGKFKASGFKSSFKPITATTTTEQTTDSKVVDDEDVDGEAMDDLDGEAMDEDLDGEAM
uniref:U2-associated protein SR140 n=1 Tax=Kwoniella dejecticola CBS 10117 TaxID=1296121 RepID=A0A1A5ZTS1_9TREE|nr:U2-associated protein SR140 [Kwoniella dejecticola CBS 10117]OBR81212.1 U2-associated protein SR140 [Kwoniella dejecticola CBS 10117]